MKKSFVLVLIFLILLIFNIACEEEPKVYSISPCALKPESSSSYNDWAFTTSPERGAVIPSGGMKRLYAPVYLPHNAIVKEFVVYCRDTEPLAFHWIKAYLKRYNMIDGGVSNLAWVSSENLGGSRIILKDDTIGNAQINNDTFSYFLSVQFGEDPDGEELFFWGAKIIYE